MSFEAAIIKDYITEFSRLQDWMIPVKETNPETYQSMHKRHIELKVTLSSLGVNLTELDIVKDPAASNRVFDPRGSRQMCMQACPLGSLLAGIKE